MRTRPAFFALIATLAAGLSVSPARADVTLTRDTTSGAWTLENERMRVTVRSDGRVPSLIKKAGPGAGSNQAVPAYPAFLDRVNEMNATGQILSQNPDGDDSPAKRSLRVTEAIDTGMGAVFAVTKVFRLRAGANALEAELAFRNTSGADWVAVNPQKGAQSLVYVAPGGSAPAGDQAQVKAADGLDVAASSGITWWGAGAVPRAELADGWIAAVDDATGVVNALAWDIARQREFSERGVTANKIYPGSNRFQMEAWYTRLPAGETVTWKQYLIVDDGIPFVSLAAGGSLVGGVTTDAPAYAWNERINASFVLSSARPSDTAYDLRNIRLLDAGGGEAATAPDITGVLLAAGGRATAATTLAVLAGTPEGAYTLAADIYDGEEKLGGLLSTPVGVIAPAGLDRGDVNGDGAVDAADAAAALRIAGGLDAFSSAEVLRADGDGDGTVTLGDALLIARAAAAPEAPEQVLTILHTNDMHGHVLSADNLDASGPGGLARLSTLAAPIRKDMPNVLYLDAGDNAQATATEFYGRGVTMFSAMNAAGFDASTLGNHEFDWGQDMTQRLIRQATFPMLGANVRDTRTGRVFGGAREYVVFRRGPVKIAVFGLTTTETPLIEWPPDISHVRFEDPTATARRLVPLLRAEADVVVLLSHLGLAVDKTLAAAVSGIDVIIGGHSHTTLAAHVWVGSTVIAQTGSYANNLGRMDLLLTKAGGRWSVTSVNGQGGHWWADLPNPPLGKTYPKTVLLPVTENVPYDPAIREGYQGPFNQITNLLDTPMASVPATIVGSGSSTTPRPLTSTVAELLRKRLGADVALMPALGRNMSAGTATIRTVYEIYGGYTRQNVVTVRATGAAIREAVLLAYATAGAYPVYFGGLGGTVMRSGSVVAWENPTINGAPLEENRYYLLASGSYPLMNYPSLRDSPMVSDENGWVKPLWAEGMEMEGTIRPYTGLTLP